MSSAKAFFLAAAAAVAVGVTSGCTVQEDTQPDTTIVQPKTETVPVPVPGPSGPPGPAGAPGAPGAPGASGAPGGSGR
jgi:hypothetical protein